MQSKERYEDANDLLTTAEEFRRQKIEIDTLILDWMSWPDGLWGQKPFDVNRFSNPDDMIRRLHDMDLHFIISICPQWTKNVIIPGNFKKKGCILRQAAFTILFCPKAAAYCLYHAKAIYEGQRSCTEEKRVVNLTRNGCLGSQKYGTVLWSGDISASWETLRRQIIAGLQFCICGLPYRTLDIGAFLPVFRRHGTDCSRKPWQFGTCGNPYYEALCAAIRLRYRLLPSYIIPQPAPYGEKIR